MPNITNQLQYLVSSQPISSRVKTCLWGATTPSALADTWAEPCCWYSAWLQPSSLFQTLSWDLYFVAQRQLPAPGLPILR